MEWDESLRDKTSDMFKSFSVLIKKEVGYLTTHLRCARYQCVPGLINYLIPVEIILYVHLFFL